MTQIVTKDSLQHLLSNPNPKFVEAVIGRALVNIFKRQTSTEQATNETKIHNNIGFTGSDAKSGSIHAKFYIKHNKLEQWMIDKWLKRSEKTGLSRIAKYHRQLNEIAEQKQRKAL